MRCSVANCAGSLRYILEEEEVAIELPSFVQKPSQLCQCCDCGSFFLMYYANDSHELRCFIRYDVAVQMHKFCPDFAAFLLKVREYCEKKGCTAYDVYPEIFPIFEARQRKKLSLRMDRWFCLVCGHDRFVSEDCAQANSKHIQPRRLLTCTDCGAAYFLFFYNEGYVWMPKRFAQEHHSRVDDFVAAIAERYEAITH